MARTILAVHDAPSEGARRLRMLLLTRTLGQIAKRLACTPTAVRHWARGDRTPTAEWRGSLETLFGIPADAWTPDAPAPSTEARTARKR